jgi:hypothetical protein
LIVAGLAGDTLIVNEPLYPPRAAVMVALPAALAESDPQFSFWVVKTRAM